MGSTLSSHQPRDAPANALPGGAVTDKVSAPTVLVDGDRVHERNLPESVVPFIDASDRATMRRLPMEAQYSAYREVRERQIIFAELHELQRELSDCYFRSGVNHHVECKPLVEAYLRRLSTNDFSDPQAENEFSRLRQPTNFQRH